MTHENLTGALAMVAILLFVGGWALLAFRLGRGITRRYEEAGITSSIYFQHEFFRVMSHPSWKPLTYSLHLFLVVVLPMRIIRRLNGFRDLTDKNVVLRHVSRGDAGMAVGIWTTFLLAFLLGVAAVTARRLGADAGPI